MRFSSVGRECKKSAYTYSAAWCDVEVFLAVLTLVLIIIIISLYLWKHSSSTSSQCSRLDSTRRIAHLTYLK
nr:8kDa-protein [Grapevine leafroll-associated virus 13]